MFGKKKVDDTRGHYYQPVVFYHRPIKVGFHHENMTFPFYAPIIFAQPAQATKFLSQFVKDMVSSGDLPPESIVNGEINEEVIKGGVQELILSNLELADEDD